MEDFEKTENDKNENEPIAVDENFNEAEFIEEDFSVLESDNFLDADFSFSKDQLDEFNASHIFVEDDIVLDAAKKAFHVEYLFPWQRLVISNILDSFKAQDSLQVQKIKSQYCDAQNGNPNAAPDSSDLNDINEINDINDAFCLGRQIVLLPTGAGKSMCFLVPSILLPGPTLIIYPLLALMSDQERRMRDGKIESVTFKGGQTEAEREENFSKIKNGAKIILANPEVLQSESLLARLKKCNISHIAIDEAHCTSEWGDTFRPAYLELGKIIKTLDIKIVTAFTATASPTVLDRIAEVLFDRDAHLVRSESDRPNIHYFVDYAYSKKMRVFELCKSEPRPILIFCGTRSKSENLARELSQYFPREEVKFYHAGMTKEEKSKVEKWYFPNKNAILCTTCAFGMGVDKSDIRTVIHFEPSTTVESYIQEAGRGGRDRNVANAILLWNYEDSQNFLQYSEKSRQRIIKNFAESSTCRRQVLLDALGGEQAVCQGCDVCLGKSSTLKNAKDKMKILKFIKKNNKVFSESQAIEIIKNKFNEESVKNFGQKLWTANEVKEIFVQLKNEGAIINAPRLWNKNLMIAKKII